MKSLFKKVIAVALCFLMLAGIMPVGGISQVIKAYAESSDYTNKTYAELDEAYDSKFFYMGVEFYDATTGDLITDTVYAGEEITVKCSIKSDYTVYAGTYFFVFDGNMFDFVSSSGVADDENGRATATGTTAKAAKFYSQTTKNGVTTTTITPAFQSYTVDQMSNWMVVKVINNNISGTPARDTSSDKVTFSYKVKVKDTIGTDDTGLGCHFKMFPETFSCYAGDSTTYANQCYLDGTATANKNAVADNFEISGSRTFDVAKSIGFVDEDGTVLLDTLIRNDGDTIDLDDYVPTAEGKTFKCWSLNGIKVSGEYTVDSDVSFKAIWEGDEGIIKVMTTNSSGEWVEIDEYFGTAGEKLTTDDIAALNKIANNNIDLIAENLGIEGVEPKIRGVGFNNDGDFSLLTAAQIRINDNIRFVLSLRFILQAHLMLP